jgi:hypothetical protein
MLQKNEEFRPKPVNRYQFIIESEISRSNQQNEEKDKKMIPGKLTFIFPRTKFINNVTFILF